MKTSSIIVKVVVVSLLGLSAFAISGGATNGNWTSPSEGLVNIITGSVKKTRYGLSSKFNKLVLECRILGEILVLMNMFNAKG